MNSETKTTIKKRLKTKILLGITGLLLANFILVAFIAAPAPVKADQQCAPPDNISCSNVPTDKITIGNFPATLTLGKAFTFTVNDTLSNEGATSTDTIYNDLGIWKGVQVLICSQPTLGSCSASNTEDTLTIPEMSLALSGPTASFQVNSPGPTTNFSWAKQLPNNGAVLTVSFKFIGADKTSGQALGDNQAVQVTTNIVANNNPADAKADFTVTNNSATNSNGVNSYIVVATVNGIGDLKNGFTFDWSISENGGPFVDFNDIPALKACCQNHFNFPFPDGYIKTTSNYNITLKATNSNTTPPTVYPPVTHPLVVANSIANNNDPCDASLNSAIICTIEIFVTTAVNIVRGILIGLFSITIAPVMQAVLGIDPSNPAFSAVILQGWVVLRNLMNIVFVLALIAMALATLLRVGEQYNYKHLLVEIIFAALLINFSLVIAQAILSIAQAMQTQFLPGGASNVVGRLAGELIGNPFIASSSDVWKLTGNISGILSSVFSLVFAFAAFLVFGAITVFLLIRIVALWILLMVSPIAYAFFAIPLTHNQAQKWWSTFLKYAFFTPIMALFLNLCALIADAQRNYLANGTDTITKGLQTTFGGQVVSAGGFTGFIIALLTNVLLIGCLLATLEVAQKFSIWGADKIVSAVKSGISKPLIAGGKFAGNAIQRLKNEKTAGLARGNAVQRGLFNILNPGLRTKAFLEASKHKREEALSVSAGAASMLEEKRRTHGGDNRADINAQRKIEASREAQFLDNNKDQDAAELRNMEGKPGHLADKIGLLRVMMAKGNFKDNIKDRLKDQDKSFNADNVGEYLRDFLGDDAQAQRFLAVDLTKRANDAGLLEAANAVIVDTTTGGYISGAAEIEASDERLSPDAKEALAKVGITGDQKISAQKMAMLNTIAGIDIEKRGQVKLNVKDYFKKDSTTGADTSNIDNVDLAMVRLVTAGGAETARTMSSGQRAAFALTDKIDRANGTYSYENSLDAERFEKLYADDAQSRDFANTSFAKAMGIDDIRDQNFKGVAIGYTQAGQNTPTVRVVGGSGNSTANKIDIGSGQFVEYNNLQPAEISLNGRRANKLMTAREKMTDQNNQGGRPPGQARDGGTVGFRPPNRSGQRTGPLMDPPRPYDGPTR